MHNAMRFGKFQHVLKFWGESDAWIGIFFPPVFEGNLLLQWRMVIFELMLILSFETSG